MKREEHDSVFPLFLDLLKTKRLEDAIADPQIVEAWSPDHREKVLETLQTLSQQRLEGTSEREEHEPRMCAAMRDVAKAIGLEWDDESPSDHPYGAQLDGSLLRKGKRVAVVELETEERKPISGALLDLLTHPESTKILVIGRSKVVKSPSDLKKKIALDVLPVLQSLLKLPAKIGVFTELQLMLTPEVLRQFLEVEH